MKTDEQRKFDLLTDFCNKMKADMPAARMLEDYFEAIKRYSIEAIDQTLHEWRRANAFRFPSSNELVEKLIETASYLERRGGPRTVRDLFGNKVKVDTPLSRRFQQIFKDLCTGVITGPQALEEVDKAEEIYGPAQEAPVPPKKTIDECIEDARIDKSLAIRAARKIFEKRNEHEHDTLRELSKELIANGYFLVGATERQLLVEPLDADAWEGSASVLGEYAGRL